MHGCTNTSVTNFEVHMPTEATFSYSSVPQPLRPRKKYRNEEEEASFTLMSDPRVIRGNTYSMARSIATINKTRTAESTDKSGEKIKHVNKSNKSRPTYIHDVSPFVAPGIDLSIYLEDVTTLRPTVSSVEAQVDQFKELPPVKPYVPRKTGIDRETQVDSCVDLFDFDGEVAPMLEILVRKTIEQALFEVNSEQQLEELERERLAFEKQREIEQEWVREQEREYEREMVIKGQHLAMHKKILTDQKQTKRKIAGTQVAKQILPSLIDEVAQELFDEGVWQVMTIPRVSIALKIRVVVHKM